MLTINHLKKPMELLPGKIKNGVPHGCDQTASIDTLDLDGQDQSKITETMSLKPTTMLEKMQRKDSKVFLSGSDTELP